MMDTTLKNSVIFYTTFLLLLTITVTVAEDEVQEDKDKPSLLLTPGFLSKPVGTNAIVNCEGAVPNKELVEEMKWIDPQGRDINNMDDRSRIRTTSFTGKKYSLDLLIDDLQQDDAGVYKCTSVYAGNINLEQNLNIEIFKKIDFGATQSFQTPIIHTDAKIKCLVTAFPSPQVDWLKDGVTINTDNQHIIMQDGILIKNITESAEGVYRCRARVQKFGALEFKDIQVEVHIPPKITGPPEDVDGVEKESVTMQCVATGKPAPTYKWVDRESRPLQDLEGYTVDDVTGELTIMGLKPDQAGEYTCMASNPAGDDQASANLRVLSKPKIERYENITVHLETESRLSCFATGDPLPDIIFKKESNPEPFNTGANDNSRIIIKQEVDSEGRRQGILEITEVQRKDDGLYSCSAESDGGKTEGWGHITVEFPPTFEEQNVNDFWSWESEKVNLSCIATSIPNATVQWYLANKDIPKDDVNLKVLNLGPTGVLEVNPINPAYFGTYTCVATNTLGKDERDIILKQAQKPGPISNSQVKKKTATTIEWGLLEPMDDGGRPVLGFLVEYKLADHPWDEAERIFFTKGNQYIMDQLKPLTTYVFRFSARNEVGDGEWGGEKTEEMPKISYPEEPDIYSLQPGIVNPRPYSNHIELMWKVPLNNGSPITNFHITYYIVEEKDGKWEVKGDKMNHDVMYPGNSKYKITGLHSETIYKIELRAKNKVGSSRPTEVLVQTGKGNDHPLKESNIGVGIILLIVFIAVLLFAILIDITCFFAKNIGVTALIVGKVCDSKQAKDKEAMLEDGTNSDKGEIKPEEEKLPEKIPLTQDEEKVAEEVNEPTETTPMIEGKPSDKEEILNEEKQNLDDGKCNEVETKTESKDSPV